MLNWQEQTLQFWFRSFLYAELARSLCSFISSCVLLQVGVRFCRAALADAVIHILELASVQAPCPGLKVYRFDRGAVTYKLSIICHSFFFVSSPACFSDLLTVYTYSRQLDPSADTQILRIPQLKLIPLASYFFRV